MTDNEKFLSSDDLDAIGEVLNISMGAAATAVSSMLDKRVLITTPNVELNTFDTIDYSKLEPAILVKINYVEGIEGANVIILRRNDMRIILDILMGNDYTQGSEEEFEFDDMSLSAACEVMNQMMGSSATALSSIMETRIDISPPTASVVNLTEVINGGEIAEFLKGDFVKISFSLEIGDLINSELMQLYPFEFAKVLNDKFLKYSGLDSKVQFGQIVEEEQVDKSEPTPAPAPEPAVQPTQPVPQQMPYRWQS